MSAKCDLSRIRAASAVQEDLPKETASFPLKAVFFPLPIKKTSAA